MTKINYFHPDNYVIKVVSGTESSCMEIFRQEQCQYPSLEWGTHIASKTTKDKFEITIKRFKTKELCLAHCTYPPSYVRNGGSVL